MDGKHACRGQVECARAHVWIHPTSVLCKSSLYLKTHTRTHTHTHHHHHNRASRHEVIEGRVSLTPSHSAVGTCHVPWQAPAGIGVGQIRNLLNGDIEQRRPVVNRSTRSRDISFSKASPGRVGSGWVGLGRAYWDFSHHRRTRSALRAPLVTTSRNKNQLNVEPKATRLTDFSSCELFNCFIP